MLKRMAVIKTHNNQQTTNRLFIRNHKGSSLIEILVTLTVLAVGLLGLASVQLLGIKNVHNSQFRSLATVHATDMAERMRSNSAGVTAGNYDDIDTTSISDPNCSPCSVADIAQLDGYQWGQEISQAVIDGGLPNGTGSVELVGTGVFNITVAWQEQERDSDGGLLASTSFVLTVKP